MLPNRLKCKPCMSVHSNCDSDEITDSEKPHQPVFVNVYDLYKINEFMTNIGLGFFHSGVEVYGIEYGYGGHGDNYTGIFDVEPRNENVLGDIFNMAGQLKFRQTIHLGYTHFTMDEIEVIKNRLGERFRGNKYNLISNNCNHFSAAFTKIVCNKNIPKWINRLAYVGSFIPFLTKLLPHDFSNPCPWKDPREAAAQNLQDTHLMSSM